MDFHQPVGLYPNIHTTNPGSGFAFPRGRPDPIQVTYLRMSRTSVDDGDE